MHTPTDLAATARREAQRNYHGSVGGQEPNIFPLIAPFPPMPMENWDGRWCAAFVHYCCNQAGFALPPRPREAHSCTLAGCLAWEEWAMADQRAEYHLAGEAGFTPRPGDIVLYDRVFENYPHDHIGIVLEADAAWLTTAEGNVKNVSAILRRKRDGHIRAFIRLPEGYRY